MTEKLEQFLITITVIEGRHFFWPNMDTAVHVMVDDQKKCTNVAYKTDSPFFNEYFTFEFFTNLEKLLDTNITLTVIQPKKLLKSLLTLGSVTLDTATVWEQPYHQFYMKWAAIEAPISEATRSPRGYLKLSISVLKKGESPQIPDVDIESTEDIESNLLLPEGSVPERQRATYVFKIYRGENLSKAKYLDLTNSQSLQNDLPSTYVEVSFAGLKANTSTVKNNANPIWNQRLILTELFPPLYQRIKIRLYFVETFQTIYSEHYINLRTISNDGERGFLPTFGPAFVYFYSRGSTNEGFVGKILIAFNTELQSDVKFGKCTNVEPISALIEANLWTYEPIVLFGSIFNVNLIHKKFSNKPISFEINFGNVKNILKNYSADSGDISNKTMPQTPTTKNKIYWSIDYTKNKPCVYIGSLWPNFSRRVYNSNIISNTAAELRNRLNTIESQFEKEELKYINGQISKDITNILDFLSTACRKYLDITKTVSTNYENDLDKHWKQLCFREIETIENVCKSISSLEPKTKCFSTLQKLLNQLELLAEDAQTCFPRIYVSMCCGNKREAFSKCFSPDIVYSVVNEEKGKYCGAIQNLFLQPCKKSNSLNLNSTIACRIDISLWLGFERHKNVLLESIPDGFSLPTNMSSDSLPKMLIALEQHCRTHIYQGKVSPGFDTSGLCDAFVRVIIEDKCNETLVKLNSLNPIWDQMFTFTNIVLYGTKSHIIANHPVIVLEVYDYDKFSKSELIGRCILNPLIKFIEDPYRPPNFPPKLSWYSINNEENVFGHILVAAEYLEISKLEEMYDNAIPAVVAIPDDIKPKLATYRLEIIFWGVRNLQKVDSFAISKPKVVLECAQKSLNSDTLLNIQSNLNFTEINKFIDISLPEEEDYAPQICLKIFDCRSFGRNVLIGTHLISINNVSYRALTVDERKKALFESTASVLDSIVKQKNINSKSTQHVKKSNYNKLKIVPLTKSANESVQTEKTFFCAWISKCYNYCFNVRKDQDKEPKKKVKKDIEKSNKLSKLTLKKFSKKKTKSDDKSDNKSNSKESPNTAHHNCLWKCLLCAIMQRKHEQPKKKIKVIETFEDVEDYDWWTKYYHSMQKFDKNSENNISTSFKKFTLKIYLQELELQKEYNEFSDVLKCFEVYKGKRTGDDIIDDANITGLLKGAIRIYKWPVPNIENLVTENGLPFSNGAFQGFPSNLPIKFLVRVYCICGINLRPKDLNGKSDPYLIIAMNDKVINDRKNYISKQVNPIFGRCYELNGVFSQNHSLTISVWDWDLTSSDDLIGETKIDIENRFYSRHRANCGIASEYIEMGYCSWRDNEKPSKILENLCRQSNIGVPCYNERSIKIAGKEFFWPIEEENMKQTTDTFTNPSKQQLALYVLQNWQKMPLIGCELVPEHVETRSLYHPTKLGIEQGKLQLWVDIFASTDFPPPPRIDITPRKPIDYELRIIIWNTEEVILEEDDFFVGEKMSDIYVSGWMIQSEDSQCTDIHYRSMTGEGNFNWRFIFRFKYLSTENKVVISKKESLFSVDETEYKYPCRLTLQVWDNDMLSADDFLGSLVLDLSRLPRGSRTVEKCSLINLSTKAPTLNLFKTKRTRGWWPFRGIDPVTNTNILAGKVEMEFELLTVEEADKRPAGLQRSEPQPLPLPNRPDTSFSWFKNPLKALKFLICKHYRWKIIKCILFTLIVLFLLAAVYSLPGYSVKKLFHL